MAADVEALMKKLGLSPLNSLHNKEIKGVFISDMVSDVMNGAGPGNIWVTVQTHKSIVPAANLVDAAAVIVTGGKDVPQETIDLASKYDIAILSTDLPTFELTGKLFELGLGPT